MTGRRPPVATCSACDEPIIWCLSEAGKHMPVDVEPVEGGNLIMSHHHPVPKVTVVSKGGRYPGQRLYTSHFATCPKAQAFRKRQDAQRGRRATVPTEQGTLFGGGGR